MDDRIFWITLIPRFLGILVWILMVSAAFVFHFRRASASTMILICGGFIACFALSVSAFGQTMMTLPQTNSSGSGVASARQWAPFLQAFYYVYLAGALIYAGALLAAVIALPRRNQS